MKDLFQFVFELKQKQLEAIVNDDKDENEQVFI